MKNFRNLSVCLLALFAILLTGCEKHESIVSGLDEREANQIVVFLATRGIDANKVAMRSTGPGGGASTFSISVDHNRMTEAMSILNQAGLPRRKGIDLLTLFAKQGLMSTEKEETIRYQAGLAAQIAGTIMKIDGVLDSEVQIAFPQATEGDEAPKEKTTASVYVKHQGILDDPNSHMVTKIKRIVSSAVPALELNDVTVISDRSRYTDLSVDEATEPLSASAKEYVSIWSIVMNKESAGKFRFLFSLLIIMAILLTLLVGWMIWKFYPLIMKRGGFKKMLSLNPLGELPQEEINEDETP